MTATPASGYNSPVDFRITQSPPDGLPPQLQGVFDDIYNAFQQIIQALINNCGIGPQDFALWGQLAGSSTTILSGNLRRLYVTASENIAFGAMVSLFSSGGVLNARNANATNGTKPMDGFCTTQGGIASGTVGEIQLSTGIATITGLVIGQRYWLDTNNGLVRATPATGAGNIEQYLGIALTTTQLYVNAGYWIQH